MNDEMRLLPPPRKLWVRLLLLILLAAVFQLGQTGVRLQLNSFKLK